LINAAPCNFTVSSQKLQALVYAAAISPDALVRAAATATSSPWAPSQSAGKTPSPLADRSRGWSNGAHLVHTFDFLQSMTFSAWLIALDRATAKD
jgi:hypothetical protein